MISRCMDIFEIAEAGIKKVLAIIGGINFKLILFFLLLPIYAPLYLFLHLTFSWWEGLLD
jgi:hypothetical protein